MRIGQALGRFMLAALVAACGSTAESTGREAPPPPASGGSCVPGAQAACACDGGQQGVSICTPAAEAGSCVCPGASSPIGSGAAGASTPSTTGADVTGTAGSNAAGTGAAGTGAAGVAGALVGGAGGDTAGAPSVPPTAALAAFVRIRELAIYQPAKVTLARDGAEVVARNAPVVVGKQALLRVFVETLPGFAPRELVAELELVSSEAPVQPLSVTARVSASSTDADLASTLNLELPASALIADLRYAVSLREVGAAAPASPADAGARFPTEPDALAALGARNAGPLRVMLVPYRYEGDGSGRVPELTADRLTAFRDVLAVYYPTSEIMLEVHEPVTYDAAVTPNTGWNEWLEFHCALRGDEAPDPKVLYYGLILPEASQREYGGGVYGISPVPSPAGNYGRCSVGVGFEGAAESTMAHELGHSLGLPHAPCGLDDAGPFPYPEATIGSWGYGFVSKTLKDPETTYDLMSYCDPAFISDFNFERLFERIRYLNLQFDERPAPAVRYQRVLVTGDGRARLRGLVTLARAPGGLEEERVVELFDSAGRSLGEAPAYRFPFSEAGASLWLLPEKTGAASARIDGTGTVALAGGTP